LASLLVVLLCGAVLLGAYLFLGFNHTNQTARMVPAEAPMLLSFSPDPRQALHLRTAQDAQQALALFGAIPEVRQAAEEIEAGLADTFDIEWDRDVMSWVGPEVSLAIMEFDTDAGGLPQLILTAATRNRNKSDAFLAKLRQGTEAEGAQFAEEEYKGVHIVYTVPDYDGAFAPAFATVKGLVVIGSDLGAIRQAIDRGEGKRSATLADQALYKRVMDQLPANRLGYFYVSSETLLGQLQDVENQLGIGMPQAVALSFGLVGDGVRLDYVVSVDPESLTSAQLKAAEAPANRRETASLLPADTIAYLTGQDLATTWEAGLASSAIPAEIQATLDQVEAETGVNLVDDLIARITGEFALAVLPDSGGVLGDPSLPLGVILAAKVEQPDELKAGLDALIRTVEDAGMTIGHEQIEGTTFTLLQASSGQGQFGYGLKGDLLIIGTSRDMLQAAVRSGGRSLADNDIFRAAIRPFSGRSTSYLFVDVDALVRLLYDTMDSAAKADFDDGVRPYLEPLRAISTGVEPTDKEGMTRGTLFLTIRKD